MILSNDEEFSSPQEPQEENLSELSESCPEIDAETILQGNTEVFLVLQGVRYRLRRTRRNKLILQK